MLAGAGDMSLGVCCVCPRQLDIVGAPERAHALASTSSGPPAAAAARSPRPTTTGVRIKADGCYVERDPNVATLRALECINL